MIRSKMVGGLALVATAVLAPLQVDAQSGEDSFEVPLRLEDGRLLVSVEIAPGSEVDFIVSTANTVTVLNQAFIDKHGVDGDFFLGEVELNLDNYAAVPHERLNSGTSMIVGIVGANTLNEFDMLLDVPGNRLVLKEVGRALEFEGVELGDPLKMRVYHGMLLGFDMEMNGVALPAMLDTGSAGILANSAAAAAVGIANDARVSLTSGAISLGSASVTVSDSPIMERWDPNGAGFTILGSPLAADCALAISWVHRELRRCVS